MSRCTGYCCRGFALEKTYEEVWADFQCWQKDPATSVIPQVYLVAPMLIPIKKMGNETLYTCKHLLKNGDCGIYAVRPQMCRDFPGDKPCPFVLCASHGHKRWVARLLAWLLWRWRRIRLA
jgi:Fe-S-cluster containining protein